MLNLSLGLHAHLAHSLLLIKVSAKWNILLDKPIFTTLHEDTVKCKKKNASLVLKLNRLIIIGISHFVFHVSSAYGAVKRAWELGTHLSLVSFEYSCHW